MIPDYDPKEIAKYEVGWWKAHHRKNWKEGRENMAHEYEKQFGIPYETALRVVDLRLEAAKQHDLAEKLEDSRQVARAGVIWRTCESTLVQHFTLLKEAQKESGEKK